MNGQNECPVIELGLEKILQALLGGGIPVYLILVSVQDEFLAVIVFNMKLC